MKVIVLVCLVSFVAGEWELVHPNAELIEEARVYMLGKSSRIINGDDAQIDDYRWQASLQSGSSHICGATVVSSRVAVTAAHCINTMAPPGTYSIQVGSSRVSGSNEGTVIPVDQIVIHPNYTGNTDGLPNDIAILQFNTDITGTNMATAVSIPNNDDTFTGISCQITGWGITENNDLADVLQKADTTVLSRNECSQKWGSQVLESHVCVYNGYTGVCNGDSGGPLTCDGTLVGVSSWGVNGCETNHYPSVYTRISSFREWINNYIQ